jgi:alpha-galactosidase/6-phospho-beta-glucosidase family protein
MTLVIRATKVATTGIFILRGAQPGVAGCNERRLPPMKVAVIGGGSTYTPELFNGFLARVESFVATQLLNAHANDLGETHVVNVRQGGAVPGWPADWVLELPSRVDAAGIHPLPAEPLPPVCFGLLAQVKS